MYLAFGRWYYFFKKFRLFIAYDFLFRDAGLDGQDCFLHILSLIVNECVYEQHSVNVIICKVRAMVALLHQSQPTREKFKEQQARFNLPQKKIPSDNNTRWNSTYDMLLAAVENRDPLVQVTNFINIFSFQLPGPD